MLWMGMNEQAYPWLSSESLGVLDARHNQEDTPMQQDTSLPAGRPDRKSYVVFIDEAGFMLNPLVRRTWAPRGKTPVIQVFKPHERISVVGAMTLALRTKRFGFQFHLLPDNANFCGEDIVDFIKGIRRKLRGNITLLWDMIEIHRAKPVMNCVAKHQTVRLEYFPPYAPELNPVDQVWSYVKYGRLANYCPDSLTELRERITAEFDRLTKQPDLLASLFCHTGLTL